MQTALVFDFLSAQNLLVPFLKQEKVLQNLEKEELLSLVEKLLDPPVIEKTMEQQKTEAVESITFQTEEKPKDNHKFVVDNNYRKHEVHLSLQDVLNKLNKDGVIPRGQMSKATLNKISYELGLIDYQVVQKTRTSQKRWFPTDFGVSLGISQKHPYSVVHSLESYDVVKDYLLGNVHR